MFNLDYKYRTYIPELLDQQIFFSNNNLDYENSLLFRESSNLNNFRIFSEENIIEIPQYLNNFEEIKIKINENHFETFIKK